ncbi:CPBP family intramembrane glutamic endopeptidase [Staphylococcus aureus]|uniref:CPBP family intramembrane glutamic endopeptidase n=1 Tax=Staphylococcus aureus TaxID=1280 RepID=UPI001CF5A27A
MITSTLIGPFNEEIIFRKILLDSINKKLGLFLAISISSLLFGMIHVHNLSEWTQSISYIYAGGVLGYIFYKSHYNILCVVILHVLNNLLGITFLLLQR